MSNHRPIPALEKNQSRPRPARVFLFELQRASKSSRDCRSFVRFFHQVVRSTLILSQGIQRRCLNQSRMRDGRQCRFKNGVIEQLIALRRRFTTFNSCYLLLSDTVEQMNQLARAVLPLASAHRLITQSNVVRFFFVPCSTCFGKNL